MWSNLKNPPEPVKIVHEQEKWTMSSIINTSNNNDEDIVIDDVANVPPPIRMYSCPLYPK